MKRFLLFIALIVISLLGYSQKEDYQWVYGWTGNGILDFNGPSPITYKIPDEKAIEFFVTDASICDSVGYLLFYTDGRNVYNSNFEIMVNGDSLSPILHNLPSADDGRNNINQGAIIISFPGNNEKFYLFHERLLYELGDAQPHELFYSVINMNMSYGLGSVETKNAVLYSDILVNGKLMACKHANGRDWWLFCHEYENNTFLKWLITPEGIKGPFKQIIGTPLTKYDTAGQLVFSPDGKKCALYNVATDMFLDLFDFDRCSGLLSNYITTEIPLPPFGSYLNGGLAFSPNSRFIYATTDRYVYQFDTWATEWQDSRITVGVWDSIYLPLPTYFWFCQLAPDNKIYISTSNSTSVFHVINNPDSIGLGCNLIQNGFNLPVLNGVIPNFPHFRMPAYPVYQFQDAGDQTIHLGDSAQIGSPPIDGLIYHWSPNENMINSAVAQPLVYPIQTTTYYLTATDTTHPGSCNTRADTVVVTVIQPEDSALAACNMYVLNLFSMHETLTVANLEPQTSLEVFDLLGRKVYFNTDYHNNWQPQTAGMYLYKLICSDGTVKKGKFVAVQ